MSGTETERIVNWLYENARQVSASNLGKWSEAESNLTTAAAMLTKQHADIAALQEALEVSNKELIAERDCFYDSITDTDGEVIEPADGESLADLDRIIDQNHALLGCAVNKSPRTNGLTHSGVWSAIDRLAATNGLSISGLSRRAGLDPTTFNKSKRFTRDGHPRWPGTKSIAQVLTATGCGLQEFVALIADQNQ